MYQKTNGKSTTIHLFRVHSTILVGICKLHQTWDLAVAKKTSPATARIAPRRAQIKKKKVFVVKHIMKMLWNFDILIYFTSFYDSGFLQQIRALSSGIIRLLMIYTPSRASSRKMETFSWRLFAVNLTRASNCYTHLSYQIDPNLW